LFQTKARVAANRIENPEHWRMTLAAPEIARAVKPGQFVNIRVRNANDPLCRRPFTVFRTVQLETGEDGIEIVYRIVGTGTRIMTSALPGEELDIIGPLGSGYKPAPSKRTHILLGGGCGVAALYTLGQEIVRLRGEQDLSLIVVLGFRSKEIVMLEEEFASLGGELVVATDDGSYGRKGYSVQVLSEIVRSRGIAGECAVYAAGPEAMNRTLVAFCREYGIPGQLTMEKHMLCGFGGCLTCVCEIEKAGVLKHRDMAASHIQLSPTSEIGYALVCKDGPVFDVDEVVFE
jgi:dihydroorotate dehydrogenase electron transfer subunit